MGRLGLWLGSAEGIHRGGCVLLHRGDLRVVLSRDTDCFLEILPVWHRLSGRGAVRGLPSSMSHDADGHEGRLHHGGASAVGGQDPQEVLEEAELHCEREGGRAAVGGLPEGPAGGLLDPGGRRVLPHGRLDVSDELEGGREGSVLGAPGRQVGDGRAAALLDHRRTPQGLQQQQQQQQQQERELRKTTGVSRGSAVMEVCVLVC